MKVLVTGGAGFIGSHLVDALVARGDDVVIVDHHRREKMRFPNRKATTYVMGIDDVRLEEIFFAERPDAVCHLAAQISVTHSLAQPIDDAEKNIIDSVRLLDIAQKSGVKKFVFASSGGAIYGDHALRPTPLVEDVWPSTPYGVGKHIFERYLHQYWAQYGLRYTSLRFANVYGPRQQAGKGGEDGSAIAIFLHKIFSGEPITIFGDGSATRDYVFVSDAVDALCRAIDSDFVGVVNVGTAQETSVKNLYDLLVSMHGNEHPLTFAPFRHGETLRSVLSFDSAREHLDWEPMTAIDDGLRKTYEWYAYVLLAQNLSSTTPAALRRLGS